MSDSFADLWNSTAPSQPQKPLSQQKPSNSYSQPKPKHDVFTLLSQSSATTSRTNLANSRTGSSINSSSIGSRPITPSLSSGNATSRPASSLSSLGSKPAAVPPSSSNDAFNSLFSGSLAGSSSAKSPSTMTIAERAAMVEKQRLASGPQSRGQLAPAESHQWAGLDALGGSSLSTNTLSSSQSRQDPSDDWGLGDFGAPITAKPRARQQQRQQASKPSDSLLDFGDFDDSHSTVKAAPPKPSAPSKSKPGSSLWDLDDFASGSGSSSPASVAQPAPQTSRKQNNFDSPDFDFDFGNREDKDGSPSNHELHDEDDILGALSKPVESVRAQSSSNGSSSVTSSSVSSRRPTPKSSSSPPPHILGQIVEMGFSVRQARSALAKTDSGLDVQAALEMLLGDGGQDPPESAAREPPPPPPPRRQPTQERRYDYSDEEEGRFAAGAGSRRRPQPQQRELPSDGTSTPADKIIAQASEIGLSVFTKASMFWKEGKEKVQKVYEERAGSAASSSSNDRGFPPSRPNVARDTRPKWMQEVAAHIEGDPVSPTFDRGTFQDEHDEEEGSAFRDHQDDHQGGAQRGAPAPSRAPVAQPQPEPDLFSSMPSEPSEPKAYVSPFRRKKPTADSFSSAPTPSSSSSSFPPARTAAPSRPTPPPAQPKPKRRLPSCPDTTLAIVRQNKTKGTDAFKLGQFSVAAEEYSKAITMLPNKHILLIPLYTNRALARIRCGECKDAVEDAGEALGIIGGGSGGWEKWQPTQEDGGWELDGSGEGNGGGYGVQREKGAEWSDVWGRGVDMREGWIKAVRRRAEALEGMEKWVEARKDWEVLAGGGWVDGKTREESVRGIGRCKKMTAGSSGGGDEATFSPAAPKAKPIPKSTPAPKKTNAAPSVAVKAYRAQVSAMEAEDALKHQLKDAVEARLLAWKKGKETNLRALLASLDLVLWDELIKDMGGKPGLADLVSGGGVKKWYMKSVSRVHPDKLNANNSTVEQRMIAGGVFGTLNEAWLAFKQ